MRRPNLWPRCSRRKEETVNKSQSSLTEAQAPANTAEISVPLLSELVAYLRQKRTELREEWARRITDARLLRAMTPDEIFSEVTAVYDNYVDVLETGSVETLQAYARDLSERIVPRGVETDEVLGIVLLLRDVLARALFVNYQNDADLLNEVLEAYEPAAYRIAVTVGVSFVEERERVIREQQEAMRELSTPVLQVRDRLLILPTIDLTVANHIVQTVDAARLMGASAIITGLSSRIAQTLVDLGVDLSMMHTVGDLQGGLEEAERLLLQRSDG